MTVERFEMRKLIASDRMVLTNGDVYGKEIYIGCNDTPDNWLEITDEEYDNIIAEEQAKLNEKLGIVTEE